MLTASGPVPSWYCISSSSGSVPAGAHSEPFMVPPLFEYQFVTVFVGLLLKTWKGIPA